MHMRKIVATLGNGTTITIDNFRVNSVEEEELIKALEATNQHEHRSIVGYLEELHKQLKQLRLKSKQRKAMQLLEQYRTRLGSVAVEQIKDRARHVKQTNHIAACEGWESTTFTNELDRLWLEGKITPEEHLELFNLMYL